MSTDLSLVPAARLGAILSARRVARGLTIDELVDGGSDFDPEELRRIELGRLSLDDDQINRLMRLYGAEVGTAVPDRSGLVIDLDAGAVRAGDRTGMLPSGAGIDDVLGRYLALLYLLRGMEPGRVLTLRDADLAVLSSALERSIGEVERRLVALMGPAVEPWFARLRHRLAVPAAGILVGLSAVGGLVLVQFPAGTRPVVVAGTATGSISDVAEVAGTSLVRSGAPELADPVAIERVADDTSLPFVPGDPASVGAAAAALVDFPTASVLGDWTIVYDGPREGYRGNTNTVTRTITIHIDSDDTPTTVAGVLAHELGHAFDVMYLDESARSTWLALRGIDGPWWPASGAADFHVGAGDFAEAFAAVTADSPSDAAAGPFDADQLAFVRAAISAEADV